MIEIKVSYEVNLTEKIRELFTKEYSQIWIETGYGSEFNGKVVDGGVDIEDRAGNEYLLKWEIFNEIDFLFTEIGNRVQKGDANKFRLGQSGLGIDSIEGRIAFRVYNKGLGEVVRPKMPIIEKVLLCTGYFKDEGEFLRIIHPNKNKQSSISTLNVDKENTVIEEPVISEKDKVSSFVVTGPASKVDSGKLVLDTMKKLARENMINPFAVNFLLDEKHSKETFSIDESFLKVYFPEMNRYQQRYNAKGTKISYYKDLLLINGIEYLLYNEWNEISREKFLQWLKKLLRNAKK